MKIKFFSIVFFFFALFGCTKQTNSNSPTQITEKEISVVEKVRIGTFFTYYNQYDTIIIQVQISEVILNPPKKIIERGVYISLNRELNLPKLDSIKIVSEGLAGNYNFTYGKVKSNTIYYFTSYCLSSEGKKYFGNNLTFTSNVF